MISLLSWSLCNGVRENLSFLLFFGERDGAHPGDRPPRLPRLPLPRLALAGDLFINWLTGPGMFPASLSRMRVRSAPPTRSVPWFVIAERGLSGRIAVPYPCFAHPRFRPRIESNFTSSQHCNMDEKEIDRDIDTPEMTKPSRSPTSSSAEVDEPTDPGQHHVGKKAWAEGEPDIDHDDVEAAIPSHQLDIELERVSHRYISEDT